MKRRRGSKYAAPHGKVLRGQNNADLYWIKKRGEEVKVESSTLAALELKLAKIGT